MRYFKTLHFAGCRRGQSIEQSVISIKQKNAIFFITFFKKCETNRIIYVIIILNYNIIELRAYLPRSFGKEVHMTHEKSCGAIVYRRHHGNIEILLIKHINSGHWSFPKGHVEQGETEVETAKREIMEETGVDVIIDPTFRETVQYFPRKDTQKIVVYFIAKAKNYDFTPQEDEIAEIKWVDIGHATAVLTYENDKSIVNKAKKAIRD